MLYCPGCGRVIAHNESICPACGLPLIRDIGQVPGVLGKRKEPEALCQILICNYCKGTGISPGNDMIAGRCPVCKGNGGVKVKTPYLSCMSCNGTGRRSDITGYGICPECKGTGWISKL